MSRRLQACPEHGRRLEAAAQERERIEVDYRSRLEDARKQPFVVLNPLAVALKPPSRHRGKPTRFRPGPHTHHVFLFVRLPDPKPEPGAYRAELVDDARQELWANDELHEELGELRIGLPTSLLRPGEYLLRVLEPGDDGPELVAEYPFVIDAK